MGNTLRCSPPVLQAPVHPHTHGEHLPPVCFPCVLNGSSPHAWGTLLRLSFCGDKPRFIPTRMGNTASGFAPCPERTVHPHTHGEHGATPANSARIVGSSPHAWGTPRLGPRSPLRVRFIPTRMGNTQHLLHRCRRAAVHPHTHGEHHGSALVHRFEYGSSPHAWGTLSIYYTVAGVPRFIPTRMGNTAQSERCGSGCPVHPHTHGEHPNVIITSSVALGSSPHAWGTHMMPERNAGIGRFIPTRMGNTV